jgi:hypothetical protein
MGKHEDKMSGAEFAVADMWIFHPWEGILFLP